MNWIYLNELINNKKYKNHWKYININLNWIEFERIDQQQKNTRIIENTSILIWIELNLNEFINNKKYTNDRKYIDINLNWIELNWIHQ